MESLIVLDMDGTLVNYPNEPWHCTSDALGESLTKEKRKKWNEAREKYLKKETYEKLVRTHLDLIKNHPVELAEKKLFPIPYAEDSEEFFKFLQSINDKALVGIFSSGLYMVAERIKEEKRLDFVVASKLYVKNKVFTGKGRIMSPWEKEERFGEFLKKHNNLRSCYIGDSEYDSPLFRKVNLSIAVNSMKKISSATYSFENLNEALMVLKEFV